MNKYFKRILYRIKVLDKRAKNPFIESTLNYNPFENCFKQTYIWVEKDLTKKKNNSTNPFIS